MGAEPASLPETPPALPESAPFSAEQRAWLNGFLAGLFPSAPAPASRRAEAAEPLLVAFGSQTGSAQGLAKRLARAAEGRGFAPRVRELNAVTPQELAGAGRCVVVTSTWGDGEPPDNANAFWGGLNGHDAPRLDGLRFAVLGLGDRNYADFCGAARKMDGRLEALGAHRLLPRGECDVDYEKPAAEWMELLWPALRNGHAKANGAPPPSTDAPAVGTPEPEPAAAPGWSRGNPFPARLKTNRRLNHPGSGKDTRHFEISLEGAGLEYEPGDALGVQPTNDPALVDAILAALGASGAEPVKDPAGAECTLRQGLLAAWDVTALPRDLVAAAAARAGRADLAALTLPERGAELGAWTRGRDLLDLLTECREGRLQPGELTPLLRKLQPRLYSISSSPRAHPGEVHLTVRTVRYEAHGRARRGVCSCWLADRVTAGETPVPVFVHHSKGFRLPADPSTPVIMVGPGTGIAPFRAFLEERRVTGAKGRNWLFFGDQRRASDFLYEDEMTALQRDGLLTRLDLAFSRDQEAKAYVQHRMLENTAELWSWLDSGAHFYVCGDASRMARDVDAALHAVAEAGGGKTKAEAEAWVAALRAARRYQRDVY